MVEMVKCSTLTAWMSEIESVRVRGCSSGKLKDSVRVSERKREGDKRERERKLMYAVTNNMSHPSSMCLDIIPFISLKNP